MDMKPRYHVGKDGRPSLRWVRPFDWGAVFGLLQIALLVGLTFWAFCVAPIHERRIERLLSAPPDTVIKYYGVTSIEAANGAVIVKFKPGKPAEVKP